MAFGAFEELAKRVYVDVALTEFGIPGKKPSISRASILSGLTRKEVQRLVAVPAARAADGDEHYNRAARVLSGWVRGADFVDTDREPRALDVEGEQGFAGLVRRYSGDMPARAVLDELLRVGAVRRRDDGRVELLARAYVPRQDDSEKLHILGHDVAELIATIDHNLGDGSSAPRYQRKVMYQGLPAQLLPEFRKLSAAQAQALLEKLDGWLAARVDVAAPVPAESARVSLGIYYFEEQLGAVNSKGEDS